jgi:hypothetical protein
MDGMNKCLSFLNIQPYTTLYTTHYTLPLLLLVVFTALAEAGRARLPGVDTGVDLPERAAD